MSASIARDKWANGLNPPPPYLVDARTHWTERELRWIVSDGVKMTAMPAWKGSLSEQQIRNLAAFLETMPDLPAPAYKRWASAGRCPTGAEYAAVLGSVPAVVPADPETSRSWPPGLDPVLR